MKLLHLDSSVLGAASVSRQLSAEIVARQRVLHPGLQVVYRDLAADPALHLTGTHMAAWQGAQVEDEVITADLVKGNAYMSELLAADIVVIGAPMYNLSIPTSLKSWIDRVAIAGKTFQYTSIGPEGLLVGKKAFIASSRGGIYAQGSASAAIEHQESYLVALLAFLGITDTNVVRAEGLAMGVDAKNAAIEQALQDVAAISA